jgi:hypothetical protein
LTIAIRMRRSTPATEPRKPALGRAALRILAVELKVVSTVASVPSPIFLSRR